MQLQATDAAHRFIDQYFPHCQSAILAGSTVDGTIKRHSDLDLVILDSDELQPFRQTYKKWGWPIEVFLINNASYPRLFERNRQQGTGALQRMCAHGIMLKESAAGLALRQSAIESWQQGPAGWTLDDMNRARYEITEELLDFEEAATMDEAMFITFKLVKCVADFWLRVNEQWTGEGKWLIRTLRSYDPIVGEALVKATRRFLEEDDRQPLISLAEHLLESYGGRLHVGFRQHGVTD